LDGTLFGTAEAVPFPVKVKVEIRINDNINVKGVGQECPTHTGKILGLKKSKAAGGGARSTVATREFQAVGLVEQLPGFAVGGAGMVAVVLTFKEISACPVKCSFA
jgi:hypothetical protein